MGQYTATPTASYYDRECERLGRLYESLNPDDLYGNAVHLFPAAPTEALDIAAGTGRDAAWLSRLGHRVTAVEPSDGMRSLAVKLHSDAGIEWTASSLPHLEGLCGRRFSLILAAAVWMHLPPEERPAAWRTLARLAAPGAVVVVTLRHGPDDPERPMYPTDATAETRHALGAGFLGAELLPDGRDLLGRGEVWWETLVALR